MTPPTISIITPVKNGAPHLCECIDSILIQTESRWELCIVDDNSTDSTWDILCEYQKTDARIKPIKSKGIGIIPALQKGYASSCGSYITRMDADDMMMPHKLKTMLTLLKANGQGHLAAGGVEYFSDSGVGDGYQKYASWLNALTFNGENWNEIYKECVVPSPCWMLHREDLDKCGGFDSDRYPEDYDLCFRMYAAGFTIIPCGKVLHQWRDYPQRTSRNDPNYADNRFLDLKLYWYTQLEVDPTRDIVLWGAGKKGKFIARYLQEHNLTFTWVTENTNKVGHNIYDIVLRLPETIDIEDKKILIAVANDAEQNAIVQSLHSQGLRKGRDIHLFC